MNVIVLDTETANTIEEPFAYDIGWAVIDMETFEPIITRSFVNADIFIGEKELMKTAYFADKIPQYNEEIASGQRELKTMFSIYKQFQKDYKENDVKAISAHNARFDVRSCNFARRWVTKSKYRYFFPYGAEFWDTLKMAQKTFFYDEDYREFCRQNDLMINSNRPRLTAEALYRYITKNTDFNEAHTALEDVLIEKEILRECIQRNPNVERKLW